MVLLAPRFRFRQDGAHSGKWAVHCDPLVFAAPGGKMLSLQVANVAFIFVCHMLSRKRSVYSSASLLPYLKCHEFSGQYKKFTQMAPADFELLINLVSLKTVERNTRF
jgi:hypothetical protein